jgi:hypothetical protein
LLPEPSRARRYEKEYTPLLPEDVEREPPPRRPARDAYLQSRLSRFYAEVAQYQPGVDRAQYEGKLLNMGGGLLPPLAEPCAPARPLRVSFCRWQSGGRFPRLVAVVKAL